MKLNTFVIMLLMPILRAHAQPAESNIQLNIDLGMVKEIPKKVILQKVALDGYTVEIDTLSVLDQGVSYTSDFNEPEFFVLNIQWNGRPETSISFWSEPKIDILINGQYEAKLTNSGAAVFQKQVLGLEKQLLAYKKLSDSLAGKVSYLNRKTEDVEMEIQKIRDSVENLIDKDIYLKTINSFPSEAFGLYALTRYADRPASNQRIKSDPEKISAMLNEMGPAVRKMPSALILEDNIAISKRMSIGKEFQNITLSDTSGRSISIRDIKAKYILIDFWASWCGPCRKQAPELIKEFKKYSPQGFTIVGITNDGEALKKNWLRAIKQDKTSLWYQLSDFQSIAQRSYGIKYIPANYLIDSNGIIIARNLTEDELSSLLKQLFAQN